MASQLTTTLLPVALGVVMLGLGLSLTVADFGRVLVYPRAALIALGAQVLLLPLLCLALVTTWGLPPVLAVGMMLLAASPGGATANLLSHLAGGDVALNVTLTAVNSVISVVTLPIVVNLSVAHFLGSDPSLGLQADKVVQVFAIVLVPVVLGMLVRRFAAGFADRMQTPVKIASVVVLVLVIAAAVAQNSTVIVAGLLTVGPVALVFAVASLALGYLLPRVARVGRRQSIASAMEIGIHNSVLAITIALSPTLLGNAEMSVPPAIYGLLVYLPAGLFAVYLARRAPVPGTPAPAHP